jgi:ATP-binding cassette subfamily F protein 3
MESVDSLLAAIDAFEGAVVIVTHSEMILSAIASWLIVFDEGKAKVFEGTYQDFLDRVGWKDEAVPVRSVRNSGQKDNGTSRKDLKRMKAEVINNRSRTLSPLQTRISEVEEEITLLEQGLGQDTQALIDASVTGDGESIRQLTGSIHKSRKKIDILFDELEMLTDQLATKSREFEERLEALKGAEG